MQVPVPEQPSPDQPVKVELGSDVAVRVTTVPWAKAFAHVAPQLMPAGLELTEPVPVPAGVTVSVLGGLIVNVAITECAASIVTTQSPVPEHPEPDQPVKVLFESGVAVNVTSLSKSNVIEQVAPQSIPAGLDATEPVPVPFLLTSSVCCGWSLKFAVTLCAASIVTTHVPVPEQPEPVQPVNTDPKFGVAVSVTTVP